MNWIIKRLAQAVLTVFAVITITFALVRFMPGSAVDFMMAQLIQDGADPDKAARMVAAYTEINPQEPLLDQYLGYMASVLQGNLGLSIWFNDKPVLDIILGALPWTIFYAGTALVISFGISVVLGAAMAYAEGSRFDTALTGIAILLSSIPYYLVAVLLLWIMSYQYGWFPINGRINPDYSNASLSVPFALSALKHATLPIASLVIAGFGGSALSMRGNAISVLGKDYLRVARLRGLPKRSIMVDYVAHNAILPMYTSLMIGIGTMVGGSVILETIFRYPGVGYYMFRAVQARDTPLMMGSFLTITIAVVIGILIADLTYGKLDPRIQSESNRQSYGEGLHLRSLLARLRAFRRGEGRSGGRPARSSIIDSDGGTVMTTGHTGFADRIGRTVERSVLTPCRVILSDWRALVGLSIIGFFLLVGTVGVRVIAEPVTGGPLLIGPFEDMSYPLGTNQYGEGILASLVHATPAMLKMIVAGAFFATSVATIVGTVSGYVGGWIDRALMTITDIVMTIPGFPLIIVLAVLLEPKSPYLVGILLTVNTWAGLARSVRSQVLTLREESYVESSRIMGLSTSTILARDVIPNLMPYISINFTQAARGVIFGSVGLYFLGVLPSSSLNWGLMLNSAYNKGALLSWQAAHWLLAPMGTIILLSAGLILFAQGTDRIFNPRVQARHSKTDGTSEQTVEPAD